MSRVLLHVIYLYQRCDGIKYDANARSLLALSFDGFRGDLDALSGGGKFRIYSIDPKWQYRILRMFYPNDYPFARF